MALQGALDEFPLDEVLGLLAAGRKTGTLCVRTDTHGADLVLRDGRLVDAVADTVPADGDPVDVVFEVLRYGGGTFVFDTSGAEAPPRFDTDPLAVLADARELLEDWERVSSVVPGPLAWVTLRPELDVAEVTIDAATWRVLAAVGHGLTVEVLAATLGTGEVHTCRVVRDLVETGLVDVAPEPPAEVLGHLVDGEDPEVPAPGADVTATDVMATDVMATDVMATDVMATDVMATDAVPSSAAVGDAATGEGEPADAGDGLTVGADGAGAAPPPPSGVADPSGDDQADAVPSSAAVGDAATGEGEPADVGDGLTVGAEPGWVVPAAGTGAPMAGPGGEHPAEQEFHWDDSVSVDGLGPGDDERGLWTVPRTEAVDAPATAGAGDPDDPAGDRVPAGTTGVAAPGDPDAQGEDPELARLIDQAPPELRDQLSRLSPRAQRALLTTTGDADPADVEEAVDGFDPDEPINRGLLLRFLSSVRS